MVTEMMREIGFIDAGFRDIGGGIMAINFGKKAASE
jgi:hypothetical protein